MGADAAGGSHRIIAERKAIGGAPYFFGPVARFCRLEPTDEPPKEEPTDESWRLDPTEEGPMLEPTEESEMLEPTVDRWSDEPTDEEVSLLSVDSPMDEPALPVAPMANPVGPLPPMFELFLGVIPTSWPVSPSTPIAVPVFGVFPMFGPSVGATPIPVPVLALAGNLGARISLSIDSSRSRIVRVSRPLSSKSTCSRLFDASPIFSSLLWRVRRSALAVITGAIISRSMIPLEAIE